MDLKQLTAVVVVSEAGSVTRAARLLHLVQPAVSRQIRSLEDELGVRLFDRTPLGMVLTPEGETLVERARRALQELERARAEIAPRTGTVSGVVHVGLLDSVIDVMAAPLAAAVAERHPGIDLRLLTAYSGDLQKWLDAGDLDLSLLYNLTPTEGVFALPVAEEILWAVAPPGEGLRPERPVPWAELWRHRLVLPVSGHGLRGLIDRARAESAGTLDVSVEVNSMRLQKSLVLSGHGWTVLPAAGVAADVTSGLLTGAPLTRPSISRSLVLGLSRNTRTPPAVEVVAAEVLRTARRQVELGRWPAIVPREADSAAGPARQRAAPADR